MQPEVSGARSEPVLMLEGMRKYPAESPHQVQENEGIDKKASYCVPTREESRNRPRRVHHATTLQYNVRMNPGHSS